MVFELAVLSSVLGLVSFIDVLLAFNIDTMVSPSKLQASLFSLA